MKRIAAIALALICLCSCAAMLEREYTVAAPHEENPPPLGDTAYRVETYPALRSALLSYVEEGMADGILRFPTTYPGNLTVDLEKAKRQLLDEDPLGNYALSDVTFHTSKIIAYYEVKLTLTYKVDPDDLPSLPRANGQTELATLLGKSVAEGAEDLVVYLTGYSEGDAQFFETALDAAWENLNAQPSEAPPAESQPSESQPAESLPPEVLPAQRPQLTVELYPQTGSRRVAALHLSYPGPEEAAP